MKTVFGFLSSVLVMLVVSFCLDRVPAFAGHSRVASGSITSAPGTIKIVVDQGANDPKKVEAFINSLSSQEGLYEKILANADNKANSGAYWQMGARGVVMFALAVGMGMNLFAIHSEGGGKKVVGLLSGIPVSILGMEDVYKRMRSTCCSKNKKSKKNKMDMDVVEEGRASDTLLVVSDRSPDEMAKDIAGPLDSSECHRFDVRKSDITNRQPLADGYLYRVKQTMLLVLMMAVSTIDASFDSILAGNTLSGEVSKEGVWPLDTIGFVLGVVWNFSPGVTIAWLGSLEWLGQIRKGDKSSIPDSLNDSLKEAVDHWVADELGRGNTDVEKQKYYEKLRKEVMHKVLHNKERLLEITRYYDKVCSDLKPSGPSDCQRCHVKAAVTNAIQCLTYAASHPVSVIGRKAVGFFGTSLSLLFFFASDTILQSLRASSSYTNGNYNATTASPLDVTGSLFEASGTGEYPNETSTLVEADYQPFINRYVSYHGLAIWAAAAYFTQGWNMYALAESEIARYFNTANYYRKPHTRALVNTLDPLFFRTELTKAFLGGLLVAAYTWNAAGTLSATSATNAAQE